eukprot:352201-Chlamydomonas_euryale.AAC.2
MCRDTKPGEPVELAIEPSVPESAAPNTAAEPTRAALATARAQAERDIHGNEPPPPAPFEYNPN